MLSEGIHTLAGSRHVLAYIVVGDIGLDQPEPELRAAVNKFLSRIVKDQERAGLPRWWVLVWESEGGLHANIVAVTDTKLMDRWRTSEFSPYLNEKGIQRVRTSNQLARYLMKERLPNARGGAMLGPRRTGRHPVGELGGDKIRASDQLKAELAQRGVTWKGTYAKRVPRPASAYQLEPEAAAIRDTLFELLEIKPPPRMTPRPRPRPPISPKNPSQQMLPFGDLPDAAGALHRIPGTDAERAKIIGISRGQVTNIRNGQFGPSRRVAERIFKLAAAA